MATATEAAPVKKKAVAVPDLPPVTPDAPDAIPHGATYLAGLHDETKRLCKYMDVEGAAQDHEEVKGFHGRMRKSLDDHIEDLKGTFAKSYPDIEGLEDEEGAPDPDASVPEEEEEEDEELPPPAKSGATKLRTKSGVARPTAAAVPAAGVMAVKSAGDFLMSLAAEANLTASQKTALLATASQLSAACTDGDPPADEVSSEETAHLKALIDAAEARVQKNVVLLDRALGLK